jgi:hypothetical protein
MPKGKPEGGSPEGVRGLVIYVDKSIAQGYNLSYGFGLADLLALFVG